MTRHLVLAVILSVALTGLSSAQTGIVAGTVVDETGAVVRGANVVLTDRHRERIITAGAEQVVPIRQRPAGPISCRYSSSAFRAFAQCRSVLKR